MPEWDAERTVDEELAAMLVGEQFPDLRGASVRRLAEGWDNVVHVVDERWAFRFPRRSIAVPLLEREDVALSRVGPMLPLPVPVPVYRGRPTDAFPWPFSGARLIPGVELADARLDDAQRAGLAAPLGEFLRALHAPALLDEVGGLLPIDANRRSEMALRVPLIRARLREAASLGVWNAPARVDALLDEAVALAPPTALALVHGDLHVRHLLVGARGAPTGVIDWGDTCRADPAIDLMLYWNVLPPAARPAFLAAYGPVDEAQLLRARVLALSLSATLAVYAARIGAASLMRECLTGVELATAE